MTKVSIYIAITHNNNNNIYVTTPGPAWANTTRHMDQQDGDHFKNWGVTVVKERSGTIISFLTLPLAMCPWSRHNGNWVSRWKQMYTSDKGWILFIVQEPGSRYLTSASFTYFPANGTNFVVTIHWVVLLLACQANANINLRAKLLPKNWEDNISVMRMSDNVRFNLCFFVFYFW